MEKIIKNHQKFDENFNKDGKNSKKLITNQETCWKSMKIDLN